MSLCCVLFYSKRNQLLDEGNKIDPITSTHNHANQQINENNNSFGRDNNNKNNNITEIKIYEHYHQRL